MLVDLVWDKAIILIYLALEKGADNLVERKSNIKSMSRRIQKEKNEDFHGEEIESGRNCSFVRVFTHSLILMYS